MTQITSGFHLEPMKPFLFTENYSKKEVAIHITFRLDDKYKFLKRLKVVPGADRALEDRDTRLIEIDMDKSMGVQLAGEICHIRILVDSAIAGTDKEEKYVYVDVDHEKTAHGGSGTIHYPPPPPPDSDGKDEDHDHEH